MRALAECGVLPAFFADDELLLPISRYGSYAQSRGANHDQVLDATRRQLETWGMGSEPVTVRTERTTRSRPENPSRDFRVHVGLVATTPGFEHMRTESEWLQAPLRRVQGSHDPHLVLARNLRQHVASEVETKLFSMVTNREFTLGPVGFYKPTLCRNEYTPL
jgi:hypothetical protein